MIFWGVIIEIILAIVVAADIQIGTAIEATIVTEETL